MLYTVLRCDFLLTGGGGVLRSTTVTPIHAMADWLVTLSGGDTEHAQNSEVCFGSTVHRWKIDASGCCGACRQHGRPGIFHPPQMCMRSPRTRCTWPWTCAMGPRLRPIVEEQSASQPIGIVGAGGHPSRFGVLDRWQASIATTSPGGGVERTATTTDVSLLGRVPRAVHATAPGHHSRPPGRRKCRNREHARGIPNASHSLVSGPCHLITLVT